MTDCPAQLDLFAPKREWRIHAACSERSGTHQKALALLRRCEPTTIEIREATNVCNVTVLISELRANGYDIRCRYVGATEEGKRVYRYRLVSEPS